MKANNKHKTKYPSGGAQRGVHQLAVLVFMLALGSGPALARSTVTATVEAGPYLALEQQLNEIEAKQDQLEERSHEIYRKQLALLMERATQAGNLVAFLKFSDELKRFEVEASIPRMHEVGSIQRLIKTIHQQKHRAQNALHQNRVQVANRLLTQYRQREVMLVKQGRITEAKEMRKAQDALRAEMKPGNAPGLSE